MNLCADVFSQRSEINRRVMISDTPQWAIDRAAAHT